MCVNKTFCKWVSDKIHYLDNPEKGPKIIACIVSQNTQYDATIAFMWMDKEKQNFDSFYHLADFVFRAFVAFVGFLCCSFGNKFLIYS